MDKTKYGKYIVTELKSNIVEPPYEPKYNPGEFLRVLMLDDEVIKGAFTVEATWFYPARTFPEPAMAAASDR